MSERIPDVFISYSSQDREWVAELARVLEGCGYNVWWDRELLPGQNFHRDIQDALDKARCVVTVWSENSIVSRWVQGESSQALERDVLVPVIYKSVRIPAGFHSIHNADLQNWDGDIDDTNFRQLCQAIDRVLHKPDDYKMGKIAHQNHFIDRFKNNKRGCSVTVSVALGVMVISMAIAFEYWHYKSEDTLIYTMTDKYVAANNKQRNDPDKLVLLINFNENYQISEIISFLSKWDAHIISGPDTNNLFRVGFRWIPLPDPQLSMIILEVQTDQSIVRVTEDSDVKANVTGELPFLISFNGKAKISQIKKFLDRWNAHIIDGPDENSLFKIQVKDATLSSVDSIMRQMEKEEGIVSFIGLEY